jgi:hypothetical protein
MEPAEERPAEPPKPEPKPELKPEPKPAEPAAVSPNPNPRPPPGPPEREQAARTALAFLDALLSGNAPALTATAGERFSFDGDVRTGPDAIRHAWREALAARRASGPDRLDDLELLTPPEALLRLGPPPARIAPLTQRGGWVAIANVSGRPVVLFLAREGVRMVVTGMHD